MLAGNRRQEIEEQVHQREQEVWLPAVTRKLNLKKRFRNKENSPSHGEGREYDEKSKISQSEEKNVDDSQADSGFILGHNQNFLFLHHFSNLKVNLILGEGAQQM